MVVWLLLPAVQSMATAVKPAAGGFTAFAAGINGMQDLMVQKAKAADPMAQWTVDEHARGRACIIEDGDIWEKGCISVTLILDGKLSATRAEAISARTGSSAISEGASYSACALSFVLHAKSPLVPTLRGDVRCFAVGGEEWYGGGIDLTPSYVEVDDCRQFHSSLAAFCAAHAEADTYREMKRTCDDYFFIPCRGEHRGVGGVFFDDNSESWAPDFCTALMQSALEEDGPYASTAIPQPPRFLRESTRTRLPHSPPPPRLAHIAAGTCRSRGSGSPSSASTGTQRHRSSGSSCAEGATSSSTCSTTEASSLG